MRDWLVRSKEISRQYGASRYEGPLLPLGLIVSPPRKGPFPFLSLWLPEWHRGDRGISGDRIAGHPHWHFLEIYSLRCQGKPFWGQCFAGSTLLWNCLRGYLGEASGCCGSPWGAACCCLHGWACASSRSPFVVSLQRPLLTELNIVPAGKGKIFKGPNSVFAEQSMKDWFVAQRQCIDNWHSQLAPFPEYL